MKRRLALVLLAAVAGCGTTGAAKPGDTTARPRHGVESYKRWLACQTAFNTNDSTTLAGCFTPSVEYLVATRTGRGARAFAAELQRLRSNTPGLRLETNTVFANNNTLAVVANLSAPKRTHHPDRVTTRRNTQLVLIVLESRQERFAAVRVHMDSAVFGKIHASTHFPSLGFTPARRATARLPAELRALQTAITAQREHGSHAPFPAHIRAFHPARAGPPSNAILNRFVNALALKGTTYKLLGLLTTDGWVVAEAEMRSHSLPQGIRVHGMVARVENGNVSQVWLFDPMVSLAPLRNIRGHPRH